MADSEQKIIKINTHIIEQADVIEIIDKLKTSPDCPNEQIAAEIIKLFEIVNNDKDIGKTGVKIAYDNAVKLLNHLQLSQHIAQLQSMQKESNVVHLSKKGFIAIDLDGTALVQKFDKNKWYGLTHSRSDLRDSLIEYMKMAQKNGYDIIVLTARTEQVETLLLEPGRNWLGTKPTKDILSFLDGKGIKIGEIIRAPLKGFKEGLKGDPMQQTLQRYRDNGATEAKGILFDDQLKQIKDVRAKGDANLIAYDINSAKDAKKYRDQMIPHYSETTVSNFKEASSTTQSKIDALLNDVKAIDRNIYKQEARIIEKILNDLTTRLKETEQCRYQPEVDWVKNAVEGIDLLTKKLATKMKISHEDITNVSKKIFGTSDYAAFVPNTKCERTIRNLLVYMSRLPLVEEIRVKCEEYKAHLEHVVHSNNLSPGEPMKKVQKKLGVINKLLNALKIENPTSALEQFQEEFKANENTLKISRTGSDFVNAIRVFLAKIPLLGSLLKNEGEKLTAAISDKGTAYSTTKHYRRELEQLKSERLSDVIDLSLAPC